MIGESVSLIQGWVEGALQTSELVLNEITKYGNHSILQRLPQIILPDSKKHKYMIYNGWLLDVTKWKHAHPGSRKRLKIIH